MNKMLQIRSGLGALLLANIIATNGSHASGSLELNQEGYQTRVDQLYEKGKGYFHSSDVDGARLKYCVRDGEQTARVSRKSLKPYQKTSPTMLSDHLVNCDQPENLIADLLDQEKMTAVLYYLDKRYRLQLYENS